jgi:hypothetical protein
MFTVSHLAPSPPSGRVAAVVMQHVAVLVTTDDSLTFPAGVEFLAPFPVCIV